MNQLSPYICLINFHLKIVVFYYFAGETGLARENRFNAVKPICVALVDMQSFYGYSGIDHFCKQVAFNLSQTCSPIFV